MEHSSWLIVRSRFSGSFRQIGILFILIIWTISVKAQTAFKGLENLFTIPGNYIIYHTGQPPVIDGNINELVWQQTPWTNEFVDIEGADKPKPTYPTRMKMMWDDTCLYIAAQLTEPQVWATFKQHDAVIFHDNDFEFFIDPSGTTQPYFEVEVNAYNAVWDLLLNKAYRDGGASISNWDVRALKSAVKIQGTLNDPTDQDEGWTIEMAIPFKSITVNNRTQVPHEGTLWRANFSRVEWDTKIVAGKYVKLTGDKGQPIPEHNWVWSPQGLANMHYPERWGYLQFSKQPVNTVTFNLPYSELQKQYLWLVYYRQKQWLKEHNAYAATLHDLGIEEQVSVDNKGNTLQLEATPHQFMGIITDKETKATWAIDQAGLVQQLNTRSHK